MIQLFTFTIDDDDTHTERQHHLSGEHVNREAIRKIIARGRRTEHIYIHQEKQGKKERKKERKIKEEEDFPTFPSTSIYRSYSPFLKGIRIAFGGVVGRLIANCRRILSVKLVCVFICGKVVPVSRCCSPVLRKRIEKRRRQEGNEQESTHLYIEKQTNKQTNKQNKRNKIK